jgi:hypothetical protein
MSNEPRKAMSNKSNLATYQFQLVQTQEALDKDPSNSDLLKLQVDLLELVELYTSLVEKEEKETPRPVVLGPTFKAPVTAKGGGKTESGGQVNGGSTSKVNESGEIVVGKVQEKKEKNIKNYKKKEKKTSKKELEFKEKQDNWKNFSSKIKRFTPYSKK